MIDSVASVNVFVRSLPREWADTISGLSRDHGEGCFHVVDEPRNDETQDQRQSSVDAEHESDDLQRTFAFGHRISAQGGSTCAKIILVRDLHEPVFDEGACCDVVHSAVRMIFTSKRVVQWIDRRQIAEGDQFDARSIEETRERRSKERLDWIAAKDKARNNVLLHIHQFGTRRGRGARTMIAMRNRCEEKTMVSQLSVVLREIGPIGEENVDQLIGLKATA